MEFTLVWRDIEIYRINLHWIYEEAQLWEYGGWGACVSHGRTPPPPRLKKYNFQVKDMGKLRKDSKF